MDIWQEQEVKEVPEGAYRTKPMDGRGIPSISIHATTVLRWAALVPGSLLGGLVLGYIVSMLPRIIFTQFIGDLIASAAMSAMVIYCAHSIAPRAKRNTSIVLGYSYSIILILLVGVVTAIALSSGDGLDRTYWNYIIFTVISIIAMITSAYASDDA